MNHAKIPLSMLPEVQEWTLYPRKVLVVIDGDDFWVNRSDFRDWLERMGYLWYRPLENDDVETSTGFYSNSQYWQDCPHVEKHLVEYLIETEKLTLTPFEWTY